MPIRANQLTEKADYQKLILEELRDCNGYIIRDAKTDYSADYAMDTGMLLKFLTDTQPEMIDKLYKQYTDKAEKTLINFLNRELNHSSRSLIDVFKRGIDLGERHTV
ncbi:MAG: hypothetical protein RR063_07400 [Anaerovoracaceae bacterium]